MAQTPISAETLRAMQAPLKDLYREDPDEATTSLSASADWRSPGVTTSVDVWSGRIRAGLHPATGGSGEDACSGDMLLEAVLACAGVTLRAVATASGLDLKSVDGTANATFDARGTLGVDREAPVGIQDLAVEFTVDTDATDKQLARLGQMTERYCVVGQSLAQPPTITVRRA